jgi:Double zinc ribbon
MNRQGRELAVPPRAGVAVSAAIALVGAVLFSLVARGAPPPYRLAMAGAMGLFLFVYGFLVAYVYGDARRRGMRHRVWALVAALVPNGIGFLAYFLLREPVLRRCATCGASARRDLAFCPQCGSALAPACPACRRPVEPEWTHCAHCGTKL